MKQTDVLIIGGGMITHDLLLPSIYHLQRLGRVGRIAVCALNSAPLRALRDSPEIAEAFPGMSFEPLPPFDDPPGRMQPDLYLEALARLPPRQAVVVAVPDAFHYDVVLACLRRDQHVLCVKPLVLQVAQALEIEQLARERGLYVGVEYHKRFDRRSLVARRQYRQGKFGAFVMGEAKLIEPYYYRHSNFQNWFTCDKTDPFVYVGCHYVDLVWFITGLKPVALSVSGVEGRFPNGKQGYLWANGRVRYENGALLAVTAGLGYPDAAAGSNDQGLLMYCEGDNRNGMIQHVDNDRGVRYAYLDGDGPAGDDTAESIRPRLEEQLPEGCTIREIRLTDTKASFQPVAATYRISVSDLAADSAIQQAMSRLREDLAEHRPVEVQRTTGGSGPSRILDVGPYLSTIEQGSDWVSCRCRITPQGSVRIEELLGVLKIDPSRVLEPVRRESVEWEQR